MPYNVVKRGSQWCVVSPNRDHGCFDSRADAIKKQRKLYVEAPPDEEAAIELAAEPDVSTLGMVAVYPTAEQAEKLAVEGGTEPEKLHITLVFLGEQDDYDADAVRQVLTEIAQRSSPLEGRVGGIGHFAEGEDGIPVIALPSVKGLAELRDEIVTALAERGIESPTEHGWTPHITLAYEDEPQLGEVPDVSLTFEAIAYVAGDEPELFPLGTDGAETASSEGTVTMTRVNRHIPVKDVALLRLALKRSDAQSEQQVEQAMLTASGLSDPEVAAQTVAVIGHLADRLRTAELNQAALVDVLQAVAADSTASRTALLEALSGISERLAEAPQVNVTVPVPEVNVSVEGGMSGKRVVDLQRDSSGRLAGATAATVPDPEERTVELERDDSGKLVGATAGNRKIELKRDAAGKLVGAVVEKEEDQ